METNSVKVAALCSLKLAFVRVLGVILITHCNVFVLVWKFTGCMKQYCNSDLEL